jgi:hypothetical protein
MDARIVADLTSLRGFIITSKNSLNPKVELLCWIFADASLVFEAPRGAGITEADVVKLPANTHSPSVLLGLLRIYIVPAAL